MEVNRGEMKFVRRKEVSLESFYEKIIELRFTACYIRKISTLIEIFKIQSL